MQIIPAIDLKDQQSVRLYQGDFKRKTIINPDPVKQAQAIDAAGLSRLHVVDLDGAKLGQPVNIEIIKAICQSTNLKVEIGGGIRSMRQINTYLTSGVDRVILGSAALDNPKLVQAALKQFGADQIIVGIDGENGQVAINGWLNKSKITIKILMANMAAFGVNQFIVTDISRDGTLSGPNVKLFADLQKEFSDCKIIASGGVSNQADLKRLAQAGIGAVIVGRAMSTGDLPLQTLAEVNTSVS